MEFKRKELDPDLFAFDIDGVVADTMGTFIRIATTEYGIRGLSKEQITDYWLEQCLPVPEHIVWEIADRIIKDPYGVGLRPVEGAIQGLTAFYERCGTLTFVTARPEKEGIEAWLKDVMAHVPDSCIDVIATGRHDRKGDVLQDLGLHYFVEDNLDTCRQLCEKGIGAVVFDQPWNRGYTPFKRVKSWKELLKLTGLDTTA